MPYKLSGVLKSPNGQPLTGVDIQFIAQQTQSPVLQQTDHNIRLGLDGAYNVTLENNTYAVKAQINGLGPQHMGYILISSDTPAGMDLPQLLRSYSQQSTAPDYAQLIEKWLAEAKSAADTSTAQAASAKSQADRAKSEADRASQISGLDTVADAIGLAAVPFPDVWIPFNDSLRMFAGYGREVKVGDDVVARMVNFERSTTATYIDKSGVLRTAAINEPRFEKQGLLIEGQSTNLVFQSSMANWEDGNGGEKGVQIENSDHQTKSIIQTVNSISTGRRRPFIPNTMIAGNTYTVSVRAKVTGGNVRISQPSSKLTGASYPAIVSGEWMTYSFSGVATTAVMDFQIDGDDIQIAYIQVEPLPFASSYIPTNGAAVTRAADKCWIDNPLNIPLDSATISMYFDSFGADAYHRIFSMHSGWLSAAYRPSLKEIVFTGWMPEAGGTHLKLSDSPNNGTLSCGGSPAGDQVIFFNGKSSRQAAQSTQIAPSNNTTTRIVFGATNVSQTQSLFGHIRNLRIWHRALSDAQIKGLK